MKKIALLNIIFFSILNFVQPKEALSWNETTHISLSDYAADSSKLRSCQTLTDANCGYLKNIGFSEGLATGLTWTIGQRVKYWLTQGAAFEDAGSDVQGIAGTARYINHFHNPLNPWICDAAPCTRAAGLDDWFVFHYTGESSLIWAQDYTKQSNWLGGDRSWRATRNFFYSALTGTAEASRQANFAQTFESLGHQLHLLQDASQPDHVRNDAHPSDGGGLVTGLETWTKKNPYFITCLMTQHNTLSPDILSKCQQYNISEYVNIQNYYPTLSTDPSVYTLDPSYYSRNMAPSALFIDTDQYNGTSPSAGFSQGLAEYTNANYFSDDTIFTFERYSTDDRQYFPYPRKTSTDLSSYLAGLKSAETFTDLDGSIETGTWISKVSDGETVGHLVKSALFSRAIYNVFGEGELFYSSLYREIKCFEDYASLLLPRAVGYSAGLLNYFFRGSIDITPPGRGIYALEDSTSEEFITIKLRAQNTTENGDEMLSGTIQLVAKYQPVQDATFVYQIVGEAGGINGIPKDYPVELTFNLGTAIPVTATDVTLQIIYHGRLGNEDGAVAVGFKDISEPTPIDLANNMDKICLKESWYDAGSTEAITVVDTDPTIGNHNTIGDEWDVYSHTMKDTYIKISSATNPLIASPTDYDLYVTDILAGNFARTLHILTDDHFGYGFYIARTNDDPRDIWFHPPTSSAYVGTSLKNQAEYTTNSEKCSSINQSTPCYYREPVNYYNFRSANMWWGGGLIYMNKPYPETSQCAW